MVAEHAHLHHNEARDSLSHVRVPDHKKIAGSLSHVKVPADKLKGYPIQHDGGDRIKGSPIQQDGVEGARIKGSPLKQDATGSDRIKGSPLKHDAVVDGDRIKGSPIKVEASEKSSGSLSHVKIPDHKKNGVSLSHVKVPDSKKNGVSLSHVKIADNVAEKVDNKMAFIHNYAKDRLANAETTSVVTADSIVYVTATGAPDLAGTPTAVADGPSPTHESKAEESYAHAKAQANRPHTWNKQSQSQAASQTDRVVHSPLQTSRAAATTPAAAAAATESAATSSAVATTSAAAVSSSVLVGSGVHTTRIASSSAQVAANSIPTVSAPALQADNKASSGLSGGAQAGVAIGVILGIALLAGLALLFIRRRKASNGSGDKEVTDEKHGSFFGSNQAAPSDYRGSVGSSRSTASTAPRLSLRPVTQFLPNIGATAAADSSSDKPKSSWERKQTNPFDDDAILNEKSSPQSANPFDEGDGRSKSPSEASESPKSATKTGSPAAAAGAAAAGPRGPNNVHRVQLDFKPTMDDELELKSGQLVRMLHEYDDGWALCIRMDRSQQGVCPRTCLSKVPVKPRPQGPPPNGRPMGPPNGAQAKNMVPRPLTPNGQQQQQATRERSQTASGSKTPSPSNSVSSSQGSPRSRSQSVSAGAAAAVPSRKPVPGQAL